MIRFVIMFAACGLLSGQPLTFQESRGKEFYLHGRSLDGHPVTAHLRSAGADIPAEQVPCASCHGPDGRGRPEGGVDPSNIQWSALSGPAEVVHASGRRHPRYTDRSLLRAIAMGLDPAGNHLQPAMPQYQLSREDFADLSAYLKRLDSSPDPGVSLDAIDIGVILPPAGDTRQTRETVRAVLTAYFDRTNQKGGIFGRRIIARFLDLPTVSPDQLDLGDVFAGKEPFALAASFVGPAAGRVAAQASEKQIPVVGAFTTLPPLDSLPNPYVFYLDGGAAAECDALVEYLKKRFPTAPHRTAVIYSELPISSALTTRVKEQLWQLGWPLPIEIAAQSSAPEELARKLLDLRIDEVFDLRPARDAINLLRSAGKLGLAAEFLLPASFADSTLWGTSPPDQRIAVAFSSLPSDRAPQAVAEYRILAEAIHVPAARLLAEWRAIVCAKLLVLGLSTAGRDLTRQKLIDALEGLYKFETGLSPPLTYGPNQRIGIAQDRVVVREPDVR
jgi:ABC-type branched-subunit amino acid transport system substrate-binding protein